METAVNLVAYQNPDGKAADQVPASRQREFEKQTRSVVEDQELELERKVASPRSRKHFAPTTVDALKEVMAKPIEDWMIFLHPDQAKLTQRPFSGPARVRGAAGTGKTVVALHRAKHLAETYGEKVLFTTYVTNLPKVFGQLFTRLAPELEGQVEFVNLHAWAYRFVKKHGSPFQVDTQQAYSAYNEAYKRIAVKEPDLDGLGWHYLREELDWVIKGRGLASFDDYLSLARTGRGTPLPERVRRQVWALYEEYEHQLQRRRIVDFNDLLLKALDLLRNGRATSPYRAVVIDEAQDLTETGLRLAYELAGQDERDGLFMVGDGQQSVYPGGFSLSHLGIDVRGRSSLLKVNYRNTRAIVDAARGVVGQHPFDDGEDALDRRDVGEEVTVIRDGTPPSFVGFASEDDHDTELVAAIAKASEDPEVGPGDIAVLVPTNAMVKRYATLIQNLGLRTQKLEQYEGVPNEQVKVGTFQRGKGLEFKHVFLPRLDADGLHEERRSGEDETAHAERMELVRRQVFVAMTRARDGLWGGWVGEPSPIIKG
jgi:superfamily I DNA/RNA helicase